jgi:hypothetical protein
MDSGYRNYANRIDVSIYVKKKIIKIFSTQFEIFIALVKLKMLKVAAQMV